MIAVGWWCPRGGVAVLFTGVSGGSTGGRLMRSSLEDAIGPLPVFIKSVAGSTHRVRNTAVLMSASPDGVPPALLHNLKHNQVLHERVLILTVQVEDVPYADPGARLEVHDAGHGFYRVVLHYGFMEDVDVPRELDRKSTRLNSSH